jgi:hypothetical protein
MGSSGSGILHPSHELQSLELMIVCEFLVVFSLGVEVILDEGSGCNRMTSHSSPSVSQE